MSSVPAPTPVPVAILLTSFDPGGTERQMIELIRRLDPARWQVHVACLHRRGEWLGRVEEVAAVTEFPVQNFHSADTFRQMRAFAQWCRDRRIAIVHTSELQSNIFGLPAAALGNVPVRIGNRRELNPDRTAAQIALQRAAYSFAHKVVANSHAAAERLRYEHVPARKIAVVPNGIDFSLYTPVPARAALRKILMVASLRSDRGREVLVDAAIDVLHRFPDAAFECVGGGPELPALQRRAAELGLSAAFTFPGHCEDIPARLANADIFVLPSRSEAFPNALLEAMAAGLPVVASGVGGVLELVEDGRTGLVVVPGEPELLADALCLVMQTPGLGARLGTAARARVEPRYSFDRMVAGFEHVYINALTRSGALASKQPQLAAS